MITAHPLADSAPVVADTRRHFNIAVFSYGLPRAGFKRSGIEQVAHDLANALVARGHRVTVFTYDPAPPDASYATELLPAGEFAQSRVGRALFQGYLGNLLALKPDYSRFDLVLAHGDSLLLPLTGRPIIRVMHGSALEEMRSATSLSRKVLQAGVWLQELLTALIEEGTVAVSENSRRYNPFIRHVIPNGVDLRRFHPDPASRFEVPSILFVGALVGRKRGDWLIERFSQEVRPSFPNAELHMVTVPGPQVPGVTYHTGIAADDVRRLYQSCWVYASPSTYEGFGLPYVEAMASGLPVVASPNPGSREVLDGGRYGRLVSDTEFAGTVCTLLRNPNEREALAQAGLQRARVYGLDQAAARYEALIETMVPCHA